MTLKDLFQQHGQLDWRKQDPLQEVGSVQIDSRKVQKGDVFVALVGHSSDGHAHMESAVQRGAIAVVAEKEVPTSLKVAVMQVLSTRWTLPLLLDELHQRPHEKMFTVGVTGTNGKTSVTYLVEALLKAAGRPCAVLGTVDHHFEKTIWPSKLTTPDAVTLYGRLGEMHQAGAKAFAMEVSSHALHQQRVPFGFDAALFTNLSQDHLDYHADMDDYFEAKSLLFQKHLKESSNSLAILNGDSPWSKKITTPAESLVITFGASKEMDLHFSIKKMSTKGLTLQVGWRDEPLEEIQSSLIGHYNAENMAAVMALGKAMELSWAEIKKAMATFQGVPGRMQRVDSRRDVYVDYAHTPEALEKALSTLSQIKEPSAKLWCVFGCGGDRDQSKRPLMAKAVEQCADQVVVTSDNPRAEPPLEIIEQVVKGFSPGVNYTVQEDRKGAIETALIKMAPQDVLLIAGKGHEDTQEIDGVCHPFNDWIVAQEILTSLHDSTQ